VQFAGGSPKCHCPLSAPDVIQHSAALD
jgi:hypothetical protein